MAPLQLARRKYALEEFLGLLLMPAILEDLREAGRQDLSISVSHDQLLQIAGEYMETTGTIVSVAVPPSRSALPKTQVVHNAGSWAGAEIDLSSFPYPTGVVDFQRSSEGNLQFFRVEGRRIILV